MRPPRRLWRLDPRAYGARSGRTTFGNVPAPMIVCDADQHEPRKDGVGLDVREKLEIDVLLDR